MGDLGIAAEEQDIEIGGGRIALANLKQETRHIAHHVFQESAATDAENEGMLLAPESAIEDGSYLGAVRFAGMVGAGEGGEVVISQESRCGIGHGGFIERVGMVV